MSPHDERTAVVAASAGGAAWCGDPFHRAQCDGDKGDKVPLAGGGAARPRAFPPPLPAPMEA